MPRPRRNLNTPGKLINPYQPLPWQIAPWRDKSPVVLLAGPAGTGKSRLAAEKLHGYLLKYGGATGLALRKTRQSMINSTVLFLDRSVIGRDKRVTHIKSANRFEYWNGSILAYGGMADEEQREQVRGIGIEGGVDMCWMEEGIKFVEDDFQEVVGRMRGRAASWQQMLIATNPGPPSHWINQRLILGGEASVFADARPEDNPYNPASYIEGLKRLRGILARRLWKGEWCQAEGLVYEDFDLENITEEEPDPEQPFELGIDDGYVDPRAILFIQKKGSEVLVFDEIYESRKLAETHVKQILTWCLQYSSKDQPGDWRQWGLEQSAQWCRANGVRLPEIAIYSPNAKELQGRLRLADIPARKADDDIIQGINAVRELILDGNGVRTLKVHRRCKNIIREITEGYVYPEGSRKDNEKPKDGNDHACEAARYWTYMRAR